MDGVNSGLKAQELGAPTSKGKTDVPVQAERMDLPFLHLFVVCRSSTDWIMSTHIGEGDLYSVHQFKC